MFRPPLSSQILMGEVGNKLGDVDPILGLLLLNFCGPSLFSTRPRIEFKFESGGLLPLIFLLAFLSHI
jgi:hypothetical protein